MSTIDTTSTENENYETRELAWELQQQNPDAHRVKFLIDQEANIHAAMLLAKMQEKDLLKKSSLRHLKLQRYLHPSEKTITRH